MGQLLSTQELAAYLKLTDETIYEYVRRRKIPAYRVGTRWRYDKDRIDELLKKRVVDADGQDRVFPLGKEPRK